MKIDDVTYERVMDTTPVEDLDSTWRIGSFKAAKKWCDHAQLCGQREGFRIGVWFCMFAMTVSNALPLLFELDFGWSGVVVPGVLWALYFRKSLKLMARHKVYMYGDDK